jgi:hypothetical protein
MLLLLYTSTKGLKLVYMIGQRILEITYFGKNTCESKNCLQLLHKKPLSETNLI